MFDLCKSFLTGISFRYRAMQSTYLIMIQVIVAPIDMNLHIMTVVSQNWMIQLSIIDIDIDIFYLINWHLKSILYITKSYLGDPRSV